MALPNGDLITTVFDPQMAYPVDKRMQVDTLNSRDSISMFIRWEGMTVYVLEDSKIYILQGGRSNEFWKELGTGSGTGGTTFVGQFESADLLPTSGRSAGDYAFVGTGDDFVQYNWDNIAGQWVMAEGQTDMASEFFHIGYKTPLRRPVIFPLFPKDVLVQTSGDFVFAPETAVARFIFVGEVAAIRGIQSAVDDREIKLVNRTGSDIPLRDKSSGIPTGSGFDFGGTDYTWVNGSEITLKGNGTYWELAPNNQVAFSDHLDSVNAQVSVGSDGLGVITGVYDRYIGENIIFKEYSGTPDFLDGVVFIHYQGKYWKRIFKDSISIMAYGVLGGYDDSVNFQNAVNSLSANKIPVDLEGMELNLSGINISNLTIYSRGSKINRVGTGTLMNFSGDINIIGNLTIQGNGISSTNDCIKISGNFSAQSIKIVNNGVNDTFVQDVSIRGAGSVINIDRFEAINSAYSSFSIDGSPSDDPIESIYIKNYISTNPRVKGLRCSGKVKSLKIDHYSATYNGSSAASDGFLIDNGLDISMPFAEYIKLGNVNINGFLSNQIKVQSTGIFEADDLNLTCNTTSLYGLQCNSREARIQTLNIFNASQSGSLQVNCKTFQVDAYNNDTSSSTLLFNVYNSLFEGDNIFDAKSVTIPNTTRTDGIMRVTGNSSNNLFINIGNLKTKNNIRLFSISSMPQNSTGFIYINNLNDYVGTPGVTTDLKIFRRSPRFFDHPSKPTDGTFVRGDISIRRNPTTNREIGWVCVSAGAPGTWVPFGLINEDLDKSKSGNTASRPTVTTVGYRYYDTTVGHAVYWNGSSWINFVPANGSNLGETNGTQLVGTNIAGAITYRNIGYTGATDDGFPTNYCQIRTFNGASYNSTWSLAKSIFNSGEWTQYYDSSGVGQGWTRVDGSRSLTTLDDTPSSFSNQKNKTLKVNNAETAVVFVADGVDVRNETSGGSISLALTDGFIASRLNFTSATAVTLQGLSSANGQSSLTLVNPHATNNLTIKHNGAGTVKYISPTATDFVIPPKTAARFEIVGNEIYPVISS